MRRNKKAFLLLIISVVAVFLVGVVTTTYAWFLSRYSKNYEFVLESESTVIIKYESDLAYSSGTISTPTNVLIPAIAKQATGIAQQALDPIDVFDVDVVSPAHTGKVATAAQAVKFEASGAYWTGSSATESFFVPELHAYTSDFVTEQDFDEETLIDRIKAEETAAQKPVTRNDLVRQGEVSFLMVITYLGKIFLYFDGDFYVSGEETGSAFTFPVAAESDSSLRYWHTPTAANSTVDEKQISNGSYFRLLPNTTFSFKLYVFMAKPDEELDPAINGETLTLFATLRLE